jgi:putative component of membrane protein insertase Oxa1/YidC/SpoIIIJ protein YidD
MNIDVCSLIVGLVVVIVAAALIFATQVRFHHDCSEYVTECTYTTAMMAGKTFYTITHVVPCDDLDATDVRHKCVSWVD